MYTISISHSVAQSSVLAVSDYLNALSSLHPSFLGTQFEIVRGEHTCISQGDYSKACSLLRGINNVISGSDFDVDDHD